MRQTIQLVFSPSRVLDFGNCMATPARPIRVACQRVRDFAPQESSIALPAATLPSGVAIRTHPLKYGALNSPVAKGAGMKFQLKKWQQRLLIAVGVAGYVMFTWAVMRID